MAHTCRLLALAFILVGLRSTDGNVLNGNQNQIVQLGTYAAALKQCFYQKLFFGTLSPQSVTFNNPAAKAIKFISIDSDQGLDFGGISASVTSGTIGTSTAITVQVSSSPLGSKFLNNVEVRMYCEA